MELKQYAGCSLRDSAVIRHREMLLADEYLAPSRS
jgi:hypothetical protein